MKETKGEQTMQMSSDEVKFLELLNKDPMLIIQGLSSYDLKKPLIWIDINTKGLTIQQVSIKYNVTRSQVQTILKNIKNNS